MERILEHIKEFLAKVHEQLVKFADRTNDKAMTAALTAAEEDARYQIRAFEAALEYVRNEQAQGKQAQSTDNGTENGVNYSLVMKADTSRIEYYSEKKYNDYGWVFVNHVLTNKEIKKLYSQYADKMLLNHQYGKTPDGYYMIPVGDAFNSYDKIVFIKGKNDHPIISKVYDHKNGSYTEESKQNQIQEVINYEELGIKDAYTTVESFVHDALFEKRTYSDYKSYSEQRTDRYNGTSNRNSDKRKNGRRRGEDDTGTVKQSRVLSATDGVEEMRDLIAVHNTSAEKLATALRWTGLPASCPVPSCRTL